MRAIPAAILALGAMLGATLAAAPAAAGFAEAMAAYRIADYRKAYEEFLPLAENGMAAAQFKIGLMYENGRGVDKDLAAAQQWYALAAEQGYSRAQYNLGFVHYSLNDISGTTEWWGRAAESGDEQAMFSLGFIFAEGDRTPHDRVQAHMWYDLAAAHGSADAARKRDQLARAMSADEIDRARRLARAWEAAVRNDETPPAPGHAMAEPAESASF
jgi:TPR repeat protein